MSHWAYYRLRDHHGRWDASLALPTVAGEHARITCAGDDPMEALSNAARIARAIAEDPVVSSLLPPQAQIAVRIATELGKVRTRDELRELLRRYRGPGVRRLGRALSRWLR